MTADDATGLPTTLLSPCGVAAKDLALAAAQAVEAGDLSRARVSANALLALVKGLVGSIDDTGNDNGDRAGLASVSPVTGWRCAPYLPDSSLSAARRSIRSA